MDTEDCTIRRNVAKLREGKIVAINEEGQKLTVEFPSVKAGAVSAHVAFDNAELVTPGESGASPSTGAVAVAGGPKAAAGPGGVIPAPADPGASAGAASSSGLAAAVPAGGAPVPDPQSKSKYGEYHYVDMKDGHEVHLLKDWEFKQSMAGKYVSEHDITTGKSQVAIGIQTLNAMHTRPTEEHLLLARRAGKLEVWTKKDFKKNEIILVPFSTEMKDLMEMVCSILNPLWDVSTHRLAGVSCCQLM